MPVIDLTKVRELHGAGRVDFPPPMRCPGGVFGGPSVPLRSGIFRAHWALPCDQRNDADVYGPLYSPQVPVDYAIRPSGAPIVGLGGYRHQTVLGAVTANSALAVSTTPLGALAVGALVGALFAGGKAKLVKGAALGGVCGLAASVVSGTVFSNAALITAMVAVAGWAGAQVGKSI